MCSSVCIDMKGPTEKYIRWSEHCVWHFFSGSLTILKLSRIESGLIPEEEKSTEMRLNPEGKDLWDLCDGTRTINDIVKQLLEEYEGEPDEIRNDVQKTISNLKEKEFLTYEESIKEYDVAEVPPEKYVMWDDNVLWKEVEGQVIAMNNETGLSFEFPSESGEVWKLCDGTRSAGEIISVLEGKGLVNEDAPSGEFYLLFKQLVKLGMVTLRDAPAQ